MEKFVVENLTLRFPNLKTPVLQNVSFSVHAGTLSLICGANGSGKSVLLRSCLALETPEIGTVRLDGIDVRRDPKELYRRSATVFQNPATQIFGTTVDEEISFSLGGDRAVRPQDRRILEILGIEALRQRSPGELSGGQLQRLALSGAFIADAEILFLDEPTSALDYRYIRAFASVARQAREAGTAILATAHDIRDIWEIADQIILLHEGQTVYVGPPDAAVDYLTPTYGMRPLGEYR